MYRFVINKKYVDLLKSLDSKSKSEKSVINLSRKTQISYACLSRVLKEFYKEGLVERQEFKGRAISLEYSLSEKGKEILKLFKKIDKILKGGEDGRTEQS